MTSQLSKETPLQCSVCNLSIRDCKCEDIDERLRELGGPGGPMIFRVDKGCGRHYARCNCPDPFWVYSSDGEEFVEANQMERGER